MLRARAPPHSLPLLLEKPCCRIENWSRMLSRFVAPNDCWHGAMLLEMFRLNVERVWVQQSAWPIHACRDIKKFGVLQNPPISRDGDGMSLWDSDWLWSDLPFVTPQISLVKVLRPLSPFSPPFRLAYLTKLKIPGAYRECQEYARRQNFACHRLAAIIMVCHYPSLIGCFASFPQI